MSLANDEIQEMVDAPKQLNHHLVNSPLAETDIFIRSMQARRDNGLSGKGFTVAVLDTGINSAHQDFFGRIKHQANFTYDNDTNFQDANDGNGHGTHLTGIIAANSSNRVGIAPMASIVSLKIIDNQGRSNYKTLYTVLQYILDNPQLGINAICIAFSDRGNHTRLPLQDDIVRQKVLELLQLNIVTIAAAGNHYFSANGQGMAYPAILPEVIGVGAIYDANEGPMQYPNGAIAYSSEANRITPFSQRLHHSLNRSLYTTTFAPGSLITSSGITGQYGNATMYGTSQAAAITTGVVLLIQEYFSWLTGQLPPVYFVRDVLRISGVQIFDGDDEVDNVTNTNKKFRRIDAYDALITTYKLLNKEMYTQEADIKNLDFSHYETA